MEQSEYEIQEGPFRVEVRGNEVLPSYRQGGNWVEQMGLDTMIWEVPIPLEDFAHAVLHELLNGPPLKWGYKNARNDRWRVLHNAVHRARLRNPFRLSDGRHSIFWKLCPFGAIQEHKIVIPDGETYRETDEVVYLCEGGNTPYSLGDATVITSQRMRECGIDDETQFKIVSLGVKKQFGG